MTTNGTLNGNSKKLKDYSNYTTCLICDGYAFDGHLICDHCVVDLRKHKRKYQLREIIGSAIFAFLIAFGLGWHFGNANGVRDVRATPAEALEATPPAHADQSRPIPQ